MTERYDDSARPRSTAVGSVLRVASGNFLEQYDFFVYGFYATYIAKAFFPSTDETASIMLSLGTFGFGFLMRPLGAIILGAYIDRVGRRRGRLLTLGLMAMGEGGGLFERAAQPQDQRDDRAADTQWDTPTPSRHLGVRHEERECETERGGGQHGHLLAGGLERDVEAAVCRRRDLRQIDRHPAELGAGGKALQQPPGKDDQRCQKADLRIVGRERNRQRSGLRRRPHSAREALALLVAHLGPVLIGMMLVAFTTTSFYLITAYTPTFGKAELKLAPGAVLAVTAAVGLANLIWPPIGGAISDRIGRFPLLIVVPIVAMLTAYPLLSWLVAVPSFARLLAAVLVLSTYFGLDNGSMVAFLTELMPPEIRTTAFSLAYSLATAVFGGFTPLISTALIRQTGDRAIPAAWLAFAAAISVVGALLARRSLVPATATQKELPT